jgi:hypothetical protein
MYISYFSCSLNIPRNISDLIRLALHEVVTAGTGVGDKTRQLVVTVEHNTVRSRATATVDLVGAQDGEFIVGTIHGEVEALIVVVLVRVAVRSDSLTGLVQRVTLVLGGGDVAGPVAGATASVDARIAGHQVRWHGEDGRKEESGDGEELEYC